MGEFKGCGWWGTSAWGTARGMAPPVSGSSEVEQSREGRALPQKTEGLASL